MDAINYLKDDHDRIRELLKETEKEESAEKRRSLFGQVARELRLHEKAEEEILYPAMKQHREGKDSALEGYEEHHLMDPLVDELEQTPPSDERWSAKLKVLTETLEHHIEEEHEQLFPQAKRIFDGDELDRMGRQMWELKGGR